MDLAEWKVQHNIRACLFAGDFNSGPGEAAFEAALATGVWQDLLAEGEQSRAPTFVSHAGISTIDHIMGDDGIVAQCVVHGTEEDSFVQHRLVWTMHRVESTHTVRQPVLPCFHAEACKRRPEELCSNWCWGYHESALEQAYRHRNVEAAWEAWSHRWKELLMWRLQQAGLQASRADRGRGDLPRPQKGRYRHCAQNKEGGDDTLAVRQLHRIKGCCLEGLLQLRREGAMQPQLAARVHRRCREMGLWQAEGDQLDAEQLQQLHDRISELLAATQEQIEDTRISRWKMSLTADKTLKKAFSYVTDKRLMTINSVHLQDGSSPTSEAELEQALAQFGGPD